MLQVRSVGVSFCGFGFFLSVFVEGFSGGELRGDG